MWIDSDFNINEEKIIWLSVSMERLIVVTNHQSDWFEMNSYCRFWLLINSFDRSFGPLLTTTTIIVVVVDVAAAAIATSLFLPYHSFIDSRPSKSITIFFVNKRRNEINESKESSVSFMTINNPLIYEWLIEWVMKENRMNEWIIWYRILEGRGERWDDDDSTSLTLRSNNELIGYDLLWIFQV